MVGHSQIKGKPEAFGGRILIDPRNVCGDGENVYKPVSYTHLPAKSSTNKGKAFSQVVSCFANGLRMRRISKFNCNRIRGMEAQFLAKPVFGAVCA